ncbi:MAG: EAL domain-containing protein [Candidatus Competibacter sp.]|nr:EAL domain-containing protein [Candidatus Competibacter sp.]
MSQADAGDSQRLQLVNHLKLIEDLWQKLYYVKWNPKSFAMLARLAQDMVRNAQAGGDRHLLNLVAQLEHHVKSCAATGGMPVESERQRLTTLMDALRFILAKNDQRGVADEARTRPLLAPQSEIFLMVPGAETSPLMAKLEDSSYRVRRISSLAEAEERMQGRVPGAIIVDVDFPEGPEKTMGLIATLRAQINLRAPVVFLAERNDMAVRLAAVRAGGAAFFSKPFDDDEVLGVLRELLLPQTAEGYYRVLIVNDRPAEAWEMAGALEEHGITPRVVIQPLQMLQDIHRFRPDLLLIDLDLKEVAGSDLARVVAQHRDCDVLPMILLCFPADAAHYLMNLDAPGASLLTKPVPVGYLCWEVKQRLRRGRAMRVKLSLLTDNDAVSGLYNRRRFMMLLERELEAIGLRLQSLAVVFVMLDNLRSIRDSAGVATADVVVGQAANRLRQVVNQHDQPAARFGDAIFTVLVPNLLGQPLLKLARRIRDALETGFYKVGEHALLLRTSIGVATSADRSLDHLMLIQGADSACGLARESKGERIYVREAAPAEQRDQDVSSRGQMLKQVGEIVEHERLWLVFQPVASMRGDTNERYEVLLRLRNAEGQDLVPGSVFGVVHNHSLGLALDRWVIDHALEMLRQRQLTTTLFIKVLPVTLQDRTLSGWLRERLEQTGVEAQRIVFSVAEAAIERGLRDMFAFLGGIKLLGCGFCLDRFGRGADSLGLLKNLGADYVKLDMYFVNNLARDSKKQAQLKELVQNLEALGAATIVGGVEDVQAMPILWSLGIDLIQGFFLQHPYREMSYDFSSGAF